MAYSLVIKDGIVVDPFKGAREGLDVGIRGERIENVGRNLAGERELSARGRYVFPGFIDPHVHLRDFEWAHKEDYETGTRAAANGGVTTVAEMPNLPGHPTLSAAVAAEKKERANHAGVVDVLFWGGVREDNLDRIEEMPGEVVGYKIYICESTGGLYLPIDLLDRALQAIESTDRPVTIHCEDHATIDARRHLYDADNGISHCDARPPDAEVAGIKAVLEVSYSHNATINIAHLSTSRGLREIRQARKDRFMDSTVFCEATPHHAYYNKFAMLADGETGKARKMNPPLRPDIDRQSILRGLREGDINMVATDHAPHTWIEKMKENPSGVPGLDTYGNFVAWLLVEQGISAKRLAQLTSYNAARFLGLNDRGMIESGYLADIAIIDVSTKEKVRGSRHQTKCGWSPFEGETFPGRVEYTIFRGRIIKKDGKIQA